MKLSEAAAGLLVNPADAIANFSDVISGNAPFAVNAEHIALLRRLRFSWDTAEIGAPMVDADAPYGAADTLATLAAVSGAKTDEDRVRRHIETLAALRAMLRHGVLAPGDYPLQNLSPQEIQKIMLGYFEEASPANDTALGLTADGKFRLTQEHLTMLKSLMFEWPHESDAEDLISDGRWPAPMLDPKRPYGDMSYFELDMAHILGLTFKIENGEKVLTEAQEKPLQLLHWQMLGALQVFVENADFKPGVYE